MALLSRISVGPAPPILGGSSTIFERDVYKCLRTYIFFAIVCKLKPSLTFLHKYRQVRRTSISFSCYCDESQQPAQHGCRIRLEPRLVRSSIISILNEYECR